MKKLIKRNVVSKSWIILHCWENFHVFVEKIIYIFIYSHVARRYPLWIFCWYVCCIWYWLNWLKPKLIEMYGNIKSQSSKPWGGWISISSQRNKLPRKMHVLFSIITASHFFELSQHLSSMRSNSGPYEHRVQVSKNPMINKVTGVSLPGCPNYNRTTVFYDQFAFFKNIII